MEVGEVVKGFGLHNAGRYYTVLAVSSATRGRVRLQEHLTGREFWTFDKWYRKDLTPVTTTG
jgi:hypothetical protein